MLFQLVKMLLFMHVIYIFRKKSHNFIKNANLHFAFLFFVIRAQPKSPTSPRMCSVTQAGLCPRPMKSDRTTKKDTQFSLCVFCVGIYLFFRVPADQVSSAQVSLTSVFGMGTGVPSPPSTPTIQMYRLSAEYPEN